MTMPVRFGQAYVINSYPINGVLDVSDPQKKDKLEAKAARELARQLNEAGVEAKTISLSRPNVPSEDFFTRNFKQMHQPGPIYVLQKPKHYVLTGHAKKQDDKYRAEILRLAKAFAEGQQNPQESDLWGLHRLLDAINSWRAGTTHLLREGLISVQPKDSEGNTFRVSKPTFDDLARLNSTSFLDIAELDRRGK